MEKWKLSDVMHHTGTGKTTIYRWMQKHPTLEYPHMGSLAGALFPQPTGKDGRVVYWSADEVRAWWAANEQIVGRDSKSAVVVIPWESFRVSMREAEVVTEKDEKTGKEVVWDDNRLWHRVERHGDEVRMWFNEVNDAVYYKLKWY